MTMRSEQKDLRRQQILDISLDLFVRNGYFGTTTKEIADKLGMSQGLLFHYFDSKDALYAELLKTANSGVNLVSDNTQMLSLTPLKILSHITEMILQSFKDINSAKLFLLVAQAQICTKLPESITTYAKEISNTQMMIQLILGGQAMGEIRGGDPMALTGCWFSAIQGIAQSVVCFPFIPVPEAGWIMDMLKA